MQHNDFDPESVGDGFLDSETEQKNEGTVALYWRQKI